MIYLLLFVPKIQISRILSEHYVNCHSWEGDGNASIPLDSACVTFHGLYAYIVH